MNNREELNQNTVRMMLGNWQATDNVDFTITITDNEIRIKRNDEVEVIINKKLGEWITPIHYSFLNTVYHLNGANDKQMLFCKRRDLSSDFDDCEWKQIFNRISF
jgi:hypothetical protein